MSFGTSDKSRRGRARRGLEAMAGILVGAIGVAAGIAFGLRRLSAGVFDWPMLLGVISLGAGLIALWGGIRGLLAGRSGGLRVLGGVALVAVVAVGVWTIAPAIMAVFVPSTTHGSQTPAEVGLQAREVRFMTEDGVALWAWYVPPSRGRVVLLRHGSGSTASSLLPHASLLVRRGYGVLLMDARGHGNSGGRAMDFGWLGDEDIAAGVSFLIARPEVDPSAIAVLGLSMGGEEAIGAIGADRRIAAVVAEGATARTLADKEWLSDVYGWRGWVQERLEWAQYALTDLLTPASPPASLLSSAQRAAPSPILMIAGGEMADEVSTARRMREESPNVQVWVVPGAGHVEGLAVEPEQWEEEVVGFIERALADD